MSASIRMSPESGQNLTGLKSCAPRPMNGVGTITMRWLVLLVLLGIGMTGGDAGAQAPTTIEGGAVRLDVLPAGAVLAVDGRPIGGPGDVAGQWIALSPGPHAIDIALRGGGTIRVTVVVPAESSGYHVVPKP